MRSVIALFQVGVQPAQRLLGAFALAQLHLQRMVGDLELSRSRGDAKLQFRVERHDRVAGGRMLFTQSPLLQGMTD